MKLVYKYGDLLQETKLKAIAHQANCYATMGAGIAAQIAKQFPEAENADKRMDHDFPKLKKLGMFSFARIKQPDWYIFNLYGQGRYGRVNGVSIRQTNYEAIYNALSSCAHFCVTHEIESIGFPKNMSCGIAGGDWGVIEAMIRSTFKDTGMLVTICEFTPPVPKFDQFNDS